MKFVLIAVVIILAAWGGLALWARSVNPAQSRFERPATTPDVGVHTTEGGSTTVLTPADPAAAFDRLNKVIAATDRTTRKVDSPKHTAYVTRTPVMGFPDVTNVWLDGDRLAISGHLTIGKSDMGVNAKRIAGWLKDAGLSQP